MSTTTTAVASSATAVTLLAANPNRNKEGLSVVIANDSTAILYVLMGNGTASATNYTYQIDAKSTVPGILEIGRSQYTGPISGIWAAANGFAYVTEFN